MSQTKSKSKKKSNTGSDTGTKSNNTGKSNTGTKSNTKSDSNLKVPLTKPPKVKSNEIKKVKDVVSKPINVIGNNNESDSGGKKTKKGKNNGESEEEVPVKLKYSDWKNSLTGGTRKNLLHYRRHMLTLTEAGYHGSIVEVQKLEHGLSNRQSEAITKALLARREDKSVYKEKHPHVLARPDNTSVMIPPEHVAHPVTYSLKEHQTQGVSESVTTTCSLIQTPDGRHLSSAVYNFAPSLTSIVDSFPERVSRRNAIMVTDIRIDESKLDIGKNKSEKSPSAVIPVFLTLNVGNLKKETVKPILEDLSHEEYKKEKYIPLVKNAKNKIRVTEDVHNYELEENMDGTSLDVVPVASEEELVLEDKEPATIDILSADNLEDLQNVISDETLNTFVL